MPYLKFSSHFYSQKFSYIIFFISTSKFSVGQKLIISWEKFVTGAASEVVICRKLYEICVFVFKNKYSKREKFLKEHI